MSSAVVADIDRAARAETAPAGAAAPRSRRDIALLGPFSLTVDGGPVVVPASTQRIIALLALRGRSGRSRVAGSLWPDTTEIRALASLRTAIWRANQVVPGLVVSTHAAVDLSTDVDVDVARLVSTAHDVMAGRLVVSAGGPVLRFVEGDLLPDWTDEWLVVDRERLRQLRLHVLETLAAQLAAQGMFGMAMEAALAALRADALRESAHRAVIRIHLAEGNISEARHAFDECCSVLTREVGMGPSPATARLAEALGLPPAAHR